MEKKNEIDITLQLQQEQALNEILRDSVKQQGETIKGLKHVIIGLIIAWLFSICFGFGAFVWYESQFEYVSDTVEMSTEGDNAYINNVEGSQYNDSATHTESGE